MIWRRRFRVRAVSPSSGRHAFHNQDLRDKRLPLVEHCTVYVSAYREACTGVHPYPDGNATALACPLPSPCCSWRS